MIECGAARVDEYPRIRDILTRALSTADEADLWDYLVEHDPDLTPECVRVARLDGRIVACTVVLPRAIRSRVGLVHGAIVTLVACDPEHQSQGFGSATVRSALDFMAANGCAIGILYGHPGYYPRFGFSPVLARASTHLETPSFSFGTAPLLRVVDQQDLPDFTELYTRQLGGYPCAVARSAEPWIWQPRHNAEIVSSFDLTGYALLTVNKNRAELRVHEACAASGEEDEMLAALCGRARNEDLRTVSLGMPPNHPLAQRARDLGAYTEIALPGAGMAVILDWQALLPGGYRVARNVLMYLDRPVLRAPSPLLAKVVLGSIDLSSETFIGALEILPESKLQLTRDFPPQFPHWSLEPFWF
jgi:predicted N-acetyltransferase YhbS